VQKPIRKRVPNQEEIAHLQDAFRLVLPPNEMTTSPIRVQLVMQVRKL
jgi:hypothetical protein